MFWVIKIILITIGILALIEGLIISMMNKNAKKSFINLIKSKSFKAMGLIEILIAIILIITGALI